MKSKIVFFAMLLLLIVVLYVPASYSQITYNITLENDAYTAPNVYEFDIYLERSSTGTLRLCSIQFDISYNTAILNGGTLSCEEVYTTDSDGNIVTYTWDDILTDKNEPGTVAMGTGDIQIAMLAYGSRNTAAIIPAAPGVCVGRFRLTNLLNGNPQPFNGAQANLAFKFDGYGTICLAFLGGSGVNTTTAISGTTAYSANWQNPPLPVELSSFVSNVSGRQVNLNWETKTEVNSNKYEIERSLVSTKDATVTWASIGNVQATGTSNSPKKYSYTDKNLQAGKYQYRLKMIDNDGTFKYSSVQSAEVSMPKDFNVSQNYPNPFNPTTTIAYQVPVDAKVIMEVYNITGQKVSELVNQDMSAGYYTANFGASNLSSGVYIYRVVAIDKASGNNFSSIKKMMLLK